MTSLASDGLAEAVFCSSDIIAFGVLDALRTLGVSVPGDVWVCCVDGLGMAAWRSFDLTTRAQDIAEIAMRSIRYSPIAWAGLPGLRSASTCRQPCCRAGRPDTPLDHANHSASLIGGI